MSPTVQPVPRPPVAAQPDTDHLVLFNDEAYHRLTLRDGEQYQRVDVHDDGVLLGSVCGVREGDVFDSGRRAPYGGVDLVQPGASAAVVERVVDGVLAQLVEDGVREVRLAVRAPHHDRAEPLVHFFAHRAGFAVERLDVNQHVDLAPLAGAEDHLAALPRKRAWALRRDLESDLAFATVAPGDDHGLTEAHAVLEANRLARGRPPVLGLDYLTRLRATFGERIRCHLLRHDGHAVAAAFVYRVAPGRDLVTCWGDALHQLPRSPMNVLAFHVVRAAVDAGASVLDIGPSTEKDGTPNHGLLHFKRSILAREELRPVLRWRA